MSTTTEKYIGYDALISYLIESRNCWSYRGFLNLNQDTIISSLNSLTNSSLALDKWQSFDIAWYKRFLDEAKELLDSNTFIKLKKKVGVEHSQRKKELQIFWQEIIKEYEKESLVLTEPSQSDTLLFKKTIKIPVEKLPIEKLSQPDALLLKKTIKIPVEKSIKIPVENLSETLELDLSKKKIKFTDFCYDIIHELENESYANLFYKHAEKNNKIIKHPMDLFTINLKLKNNQYTSLEEFEKDICLIFRNCYIYNDIESEIYCSAEALEYIFNKKWNEKLIFQDKQTRELKRARDNDTDNDTDRSWKKQIQILEQNKNNLIYRQIINDALLITSAYESLVIGNIIPFIKILKTFLLTRSKMSLSLADESMLQAIVESLLPLKYRIPELSLVMDGKKLKGSGRFGYSDIFILKGTGNNYISLELKYISLVGLMKNLKVEFGANELENLDKILEKKNEEILLKRPYTYWSKELKKTNQTTIGEVLNNGINQLKLYINTISKGKVANYFSSGIFDERIEIIKSNPNKLKGFVILVISFRRILWKSIEEVISNYDYNKI